MPGPDKIMLIRHAEKPEPGVASGVDETGVPDSHSLVPRGWERAGALVSFFEHATRQHIATPATIFAASPDAGSDPSKSKRPRETVKALHEKLTAEWVDAFGIGDESTVITEIKKRTAPVLVCWEHKHIPIIAAGFVSNPPDWGDRFDPVWVLDRVQADSGYQLTIVYQDLLSGDMPAA